MDIRKSIIEKASQLLEKYGYKKVTIDDIARETGVSHSTIYKYFKSKNEIVAHVARKEAEETGRLIEEIIAKDLPGIEKLEEVLIFLVRRILTKKNMYRITFSDLIEIYPVIEKVIEQEEKKAKERLKKILVQIKDEYDASYDPDALTDSLFFVISGINNLLIIKNFNEDEVVNHFRTLFTAFKEIEKGDGR